MVEIGIVRVSMHERLMPVPPTVGYNKTTTMLLDRAIGIGRGNKPR
jgi:hypothetical protein